MSQPRRFRSQENKTEEGPGESVITRAHPQFGLFVTVRDSDFSPGNDSLEVRMEASADGEIFAPIDSAAPAIDSVMTVESADMHETVDGDGNTVYATFLTYHNAPVEHVRTNIVEHSGGFGVTTDIYLSGWTQRGASFEYLAENRQISPN